MPMIRSAALRGFRSTVAELGGDADVFAAAAGLPVAALDGDDIPVDDVAVARALEIAARELSCPDLGLRIAARQELAMLGPLAPAIRHAPNAAEAVRHASRYLFLHARAMRIDLCDDPDGHADVLAIRYAVADGDTVSAQAVDLGLGFVHRAIEALAGDRYRLFSVDLPHCPIAGIERYEHFFGAPVRTGRPCALLRVPRSLAAQVWPGAEERLMHRALAVLAEQAQTAAEPALADRVRSVCLRHLGAADIETVAHLLGLHPRTMQRRLAAADASFLAILDDVRREEAHRLLTTTDIPIGRIAALLGLARQSALTRCARRWWHRTPTRVRAESRGVARG